MKDVKLVVADIDGTLMGFRRHTFSDRTRDVINKLRDNGVYFGIASGRSIFMQLDKMYLDWGFDKQFDILIGANGCELYDGLNDKYYSEYMLDVDTIKEIYELMSKFSLDSTIYVGEEAWCLATNVLMTAFFMKNYEKRKFRFVDDVSEMWKNENNKIMFRTTDARIPDILEYIKEHGDLSKYNVVRTAPGNLEFHHPDANKGVALLDFCKLNDIDINKVMAFGDAANDIEMMKVAGLGVCLLNGTDDAKAVADVITEYDADDEGFADYIEKHVLDAD